MLCDEPLSELSVIVSVPLRVPAADGLNETFTWQLVFGAREVGHAFVWRKSPAAVILETDSGLSPVFVSVTACDALVEPTTVPAKLSTVGDTLATGAIPVPLRESEGVDTELLCRVSTPLRDPRVVGAKATVTRQLALGANVDPQLLLWLKSPVMVQPEIASGAPPTFVIVNVWPVLVVPTIVFVQFGTTVIQNTVEVVPNQRWYFSQFT